MTADPSNIRRMAKLLIADDLVPIRQMVRITLSTQGWTILEAKNGTEALELARAEKPDLVAIAGDHALNGPDPAADRKSTRLNSSHSSPSRMPSSA